ncbi:hypothetical protein [Pseudonocardia sp. ICBG601]|uniref:hypothetical protein n=1 Tax=Pseudonocardia sp. ICBG601 TaxID=2846759 RepID=UPI0027E268FA|nr:hypothetical protein [Pseudonocardia sp. ICBG601]
MTHTGTVIRGDGVFVVVELGPARSRFLWTELLDLPLGALGRFGWPLVRPAFRAGVAHIAAADGRGDRGPLPVLL